ncbi:hypothetical protein BSQ39_07595 [Loigolactobacillus backii]|uniref:endonuclease/exonuclease/phosphatase family protein n=1 Tax=Loigolactobacillus backii TaxID=375175 RepID=UPI000C1CA77D|nr:endonuclease/exonuclease/phosphatase family protein [Loigolactobacillus backii]PIO83429.1 hypothetical protein BSQ39_07595 [Loigolactobacillus backii]
MNIGNRQMQVFFWNCNGALRKKLAVVLRTPADLYIIAEAERSAPWSELLSGYDSQYVNEYGDKKGILIFSKIAPFKLLDWPTHRIHYAIPILFEGQLVIGVWIKGNYVEDLYTYLDCHFKQLDAETLIVGDFNSNVIWDKSHYPRSHTELNQLLAQKGLTSYYHQKYAEKFGQETRATFYLWHHRDRPFYIDYVYGAAQRLIDFEIIDQACTAQSDHCGLLCAVRV